ncbi:hypothetical protein Fmac_018517 [Flemingia macrophylla]|uniref:Xylanase inhibitor C-terminal domain-containing protein n=1 Tax=Flemingia macrophylla TaxID=520843 RepID=A0ABD1M5A4_9FABA
MGLKASIANQPFNSLENCCRKDLSNTTSFSYCLVDHESDAVSTLEFDTLLPRNAVIALLLRNPELDTFCYIGLKGISIGGEALEVPNASFEVDTTADGDIIVDSGMTVRRLRSEVYEKLREAFVRGTKGLAKAKGLSNSLFDTCYDLSSRDSVEEERRRKDEERKKKKKGKRKKEEREMKREERRNNDTVSKPFFYKQLKGPIPHGFGKEMNSLEDLDFSYNKLQGDLPSLFGNYVDCKA